MSLKGDLAYQGLEDLLRADLASQGGGRLTLRHGAHYAALFLDEAGLYVLNPDLLSVEMILEACVVRGTLKREVVTRLRAGSLSGGRLIDQLLADGTIEEADFNELLAAEVEDTVLDMLLWEEGVYRFEREPFEPANFGLLGRICVDPVGVAERALSRIDARREIGDRLGDNALLFDPVAGELPPLASDTDRIHEVYARIDGQTIVHEMALQMGAPRYEVLNALARLHEAGLVRPTGPDDLARAATARAADGQHAIARALVLQWAEHAPEDPAPLRKLASLAQDAGDKEAEIESQCALGSLFIQQGEPGQALEIFTRAMHQAPADDVVLAGLRLAAEAAGDNDALVDGTLLTAQTKLDEGDADGAFKLLEPLTLSHPSNMAVHLLRARALVQSEKRSEFFEQAEVVGQVLSREGCRTEADREVAEFFRETIAHLAPDRGDLLEHFRVLYDPRKRRRRAFALVAALLFVIGGAGVYLWPASPSALLARAQEASDAGDKGMALEMIGKLVDRYPDSPEAEQAYHLQARLFPPAPASGRARKALMALKKTIEADMPAFTDSLAALPDQGAQGSVRAVLEPLSSTKAKAIRKDVLEPSTEALAEHTARLHEAVLVRVKVLAGTAGANERLYGDLIALREFLDEASRLRNPTWIADVKASSELLYRAASLSGDRVLTKQTQDLARAAMGLDQAAAYYDEHMGRAQLTLATREIEEADRRCKEEAPRLMVGGHLDQADACYARLESLISRYGDRKAYEGLIASVKRRQLPQLIKDRRAQIADIRGRLAKAQQHEDAGHLAMAVKVYAALVNEYWLIRFENVCTLPLEVITTPAGATVTMDGQVVGTTPTIVRYAWGSEAHVKVEATGFTAVTHELRTAEETPASRLHLALTPAPLWQREASPRLRSQPLGVGEDILITDHRGLLNLHAGTDGEIRWTRDLSSLEGVRAKPALAGGVLHVARVDGRLFFVAAKDGAVLGDVRIARPYGDVASLKHHVAIATANGQVVVLRDKKIEKRESLDAMPTAGVVAAHGAFWIGTADGTVVRIDPMRGQRRVIRCTRGTSPIVALAGTPSGVLVTTSDGTLLALDTAGERRWKQPSVGDLVGSPAEVDGFAATVDRAGRVHTFRATDGEPQKVIDSGGRPAHGLLASGTTLVLVLADGGLRAYDLRTATVLAKVKLSERAGFPAAALSSERLLVPLGKSAMGLVPTPRRP